MMGHWCVGLESQVDGVGLESQVDGAQLGGARITGRWGTVGWG